MMGIKDLKKDNPQNSQKFGKNNKRIRNLTIKPEPESGA